jgi:hypothetical protein
VAKLEEMVQQGRDRYASAFRAAEGDRVAQAHLALKLGLAQQALDDILLPSPAELLGLAGMKLQLDLLLSLGQADEVGPILRDEGVVAHKGAFPYHDLPAPPGPGARALYPAGYRWSGYDWLDVQHAAAVGDYARAKRALRRLRSGLAVGHDRLKRDLRNLDRGDWELVGGVLGGPPPFLPIFAAWALGRSLEKRAALQVGERLLRAQQADLCVLEGLLALEQGTSDDARSAFLEARRLGAGTDFAAAAIVGGYLPRLRAFSPVR